MPRLYFHIHNGYGVTRDEEGIEATDDAAAFHLAVENIRSIIAEEARHGVIDLEGHIDVADPAGRVLLRVFFVEAFEIRLPDAGLDRP